MPLARSSALNDCSKPFHQLSIVVAILVANKPAIAASTAAASPISNWLVDTPPAPASCESTALTLAEVVEFKISMAGSAPARDDSLLLLPCRPVVQRFEVPIRELTGEPFVAVVPRLVRRVAEAAGLHGHHLAAAVEPVRTPLAEARVGNEWRRRVAVRLQTATASRPEGRGQQLAVADLG